VYDSNLNNFTSPHLNTKDFVTVVGDLNITRRNWNAYPPGHPLIESSLRKLTESLRVMCQDNTDLHLGITRDGFMLGDEFVEKNNQICKNVAAILFERGIGALHFIKPPDREELLSLFGILALKREEVFAQGGVERLWNEAGISSIEVRGIRYDRFSGTEELRLIQDGDVVEAPGSLWEKFVYSLMKGDTGLSDTAAEDGVRPELLAATLNAHFGRRTVGGGGGLSSSAQRSVSAIIQEIMATSGGEERTSGNLPTAGNGADHADWSDVLLDTPQPVKADLAAFITALDPTLRRQILNGFCEVSSDSETVATELLRYLPPTVLQETYATAEEYAAAPPLLQEILKQLLPHLVDSYKTCTPDDEMHSKIQTLLQEHQREAYMPDEYMQGLLDTLSSEVQKQVNGAELQEISRTLSPQFINSHGSEIIMQLVLADPTSETAQNLILNLADLCGHFLEMGDYSQVLKVLSQAADPRLPQPLRSAMRDAFCRREFLDEILSGLTIWGKPKYDQVALLIKILGRAFIEPLLDRMAEEENMSLRRFMMDRVQSFESVARPYLLARLSDNRWYVLRNIIIMLRGLAQTQDSEQLRPLLKHSNQKVRYEAMKSLIMLGDPMAQRQIIRDLDSTDRETQLSAINMAGRNSPPEMARKLLSLVNSGGYSAVECELKSAAVHALAEIGRPELLPELAKVLSARSLLAYKALNRLKLDIIRSLERYPASAAQPLLKRLATGNDDVAQQAAESLKSFRSKTP